MSKTCYSTVGTILRDTWGVENSGGVSKLLSQWLQRTQRCPTPENFLNEHTAQKEKKRWPVVSYYLKMQSFTIKVFSLTQGKIWSGY